MFSTVAIFSIILESQLIEHGGSVVMRFLFFTGYFNGSVVIDLKQGKRQSGNYRRNPVNHCGAFTTLVFLWRREILVIR
jgi:hypothetical protein